MFSQNKSIISVQESPAASLLFPMIDCKKKGTKSGMSGQAFGTGDFDDEEDVYDIYKQDALESYNFDLGGQVQNDQKKLLEKSYGFSFENDILILKKFIHSSQTQAAPKVFKGPEIPTDFNFMHKLSNKHTNANESNDPMNNYLKTASERGNVLGEEPIKPNSIFDLINPSDKQFLLDRKEQQKLREETKRESNEKIKENRSKRYADFITNMKKEIPGIEIYEIFNKKKL